MSRLTRFVLAILLGGLLAAGAQSADDKYVAIFHLLNEADVVMANQPTTALKKFLEAQSALKKLRAEHPTWNEKVVEFRLADVARQIEILSKSVPASKPAPTEAPTAVVAQSPSAPLVVLPTRGTAPQPRTGPSPEDEVHRLTMQNTLLEAKLREALSVQPAAADPRELAKAQETVRTLQKENELLKVSLLEAAQKAPQSVAPVPVPAPAPSPAVNPGGAGMGELRQKLDEQTTLVSALHRQRELLEQEIADLKGKLSRAASAPAVSGLPVDAQVSALTVSNKMLRAELILAESRIAELAKQPPSGRSGGPAPSSSELESLRARLAVLEAQKVPYSAAELALFKTPPPKLAQPEVALRRRAPEPPPGTGALVEDARRAVEAGRYQEAEKKFLEVLRQDENNVYTLANLAAVQCDLNKHSEAEKLLERALAVDPQDPSSLYLYGSLRFQAGKYDEALQHLSLAAKLRPDHPQTQYFLGRTLTEKGQRQAAETALRKAIQLRPGWGEPHYALAVVYGTQEPAYRELAQWHYQRALTGGTPRNKDFEKHLEKLAPAK